MHIEARLFELLTAFFALATVVYAVLTAYSATAASSGQAPRRSS